MKTLLLNVFFGLGCSFLIAQSPVSNVEFIGDSKIKLSVKAGELNLSGTLSSGETIKTVCDHGACFLKIFYKERAIDMNIGDVIAVAQVYEFDFGSDGDKELVVINEFSETAYLYVFSYGKGMIQKLFEKEISHYNTKIKTNYIEYFMPHGLDEAWNFYQGKFCKLQLFD